MQLSHSHIHMSKKSEASDDCLSEGSVNGIFGVSLHCSGFVRVWWICCVVTDEIEVLVFEDER